MICLSLLFQYILKCSESKGKHSQRELSARTKFISRAIYQKYFQGFISSYFSQIPHCISLRLAPALLYCSVPHIAISSVQGLLSASSKFSRIGPSDSYKYISAFIFPPFFLSLRKISVQKKHQKYSNIIIFTASERLKHSTFLQLLPPFFPYELSNSCMMYQKKKQQQCWFYPRDKEIGDQVDLDIKIYIQCFLKKLKLECHF